ncbi:MAG: TIR domain-containing protein [Ignavibacteria bacterium]|nr:TIR domain-containing protein [Bacteroidota bacterium]MBL7128073.1 TIR domain-containing protein [Ignavibacteria bacterium]
MIKREKDLNRINELLKHFSIVFIIGPRQIGKTTLAKDLNPDIYYSFDAIKSDTDFFKKIKHIEKGLIVLDDINSNDFYIEVKKIVDSNKNLRFIILVSEMLNFLNTSSNNLIGRAAYYELQGLRLSEVNNDIDNQLLKGGFPNSYSLDIEQSFEYRLNYLKPTISLNLTESEFKISPHLVQKFLFELSFRSSQILNKTQFSSLLSVARSTIDTYLTFFEQFFFIRLIPNIDNQKSPKVIIKDSGIHNCLLNITTIEQLKSSSYYFQIWESYVIETILKEFSVRNPSYYKDKTGTEIDLIVEINQETYGFIFSNSGTFATKEKINDLIEVLNFKKLIVINNINLNKSLGDKIILSTLENIRKNIEGEIITDKTKDKHIKTREVPKLNTFISYSHKDSDFVAKLKSKLEKADINIHIDIEKLKYGDNIKDFINNTVKETDYTVQVISINSLRSPYVMIEYLETQLYQTAWDEKKYFPIFIDKSVFDDKTYIELADDVLKEIDGVNNFINQAITRNLHITPYNTKRERLIDLLNSLGKAIDTLRESLLGDFTDDKKFENNIKLLIDSMKTTAHNMRS